MDSGVQFARSFDGTMIAYRVSGGQDDSKLPVVNFVHGLPNDVALGELILVASTSPNTRWAGYLTDGRPILSWNQRGMGSTDREAADLSVDTRVRDFEAVAEKLPFERFGINTVGSGSLAGIMYAAKHPERVARLNLSFPCINGEHFWSLPHWRAMEVLAEASWDTFCDASSIVIAGLDNIGFVDPRKYSDYVRRAADSDPFLGLIAADRQSDVSEHLPQLKFPVLVSVSTIAEPYFRQACRLIAEKAPDVRLVASVSTPRIATSFFEEEEVAAPVGIGTGASHDPVHGPRGAY